MSENHSKIFNSNIGNIVTDCIIGAKHVEKDRCCQDASVASLNFYKGIPYALIAVADGHGSDKYFRSEIGAHFAVQSAISATADWITSCENDRKDASGNWVRSAFIEFGKRFASNLKRYWDDRVAYHLNCHPVEESIGENDISIYGTTIALAIIFDGQIFFGAIGDSTVLVLKKNDQVLDVLAGYQDKPLGLTTASLVQDNAAVNWKSDRVSMDSVKMVCVVTDGFTDSLADPSQTLLSLCETTQQKGIDWLECMTNQFLTHLSDQGVGDDIASVFYFPKLSDKCEDAGELINE